MLLLLFLHILARSEVNYHINDESNENETQEMTEEYSPGLKGKAKYSQQQEEEEEIQIFEPSKHFNANNINAPTQDSTEINNTEFNNTDHNSTNYESNNTDHNSTNNESNNTDHNSTNYESNNTDHNFTNNESKGTYQYQYLGEIEKLIKRYFDKLALRIDGIDSRLDDISKQINTNFKIQSGEFSKNSSYDSTGIIKIYPESDDGNEYASGNLVKIGKILFFSTCRHVIKTLRGLIRTIKLIKLYDGPVLEPEGPIYIFTNANNSYDYALIKINLTAYNNTEELFSRAATISNSSAVLSEIVRGITYRDVNLVYIQGQIVEIEHNYSNIFQTDCGGTQGSSGSGYFDEYGKLKVIHKGSGFFLGEDELDDSNEFESFIFNKSNAPLLNSVKKAYDACSNADPSNNVSMNYCFKNVSSSISIHTRNPRTIVLDASQLYNLFSNTTKNTLEVRQNDTLKRVNGKYELIKKDS